MNAGIQYVKKPFVSCSFFFFHYIKKHNEKWSEIGDLNPYRLLGKQKC